MSLINNITCEATQKNTGFNGCPVDIGLIKGAILIPKDKWLTQTELADVKGTLQDLTLETISSRAYPIFTFEAITDNSEDTTIETLGYGGKRPIKEGRYDWTFSMIEGVFYNNKLRSFNNNKKYKVLFFDNENRMYGVNTYNSDDAEYQLAGFSLDFIYTYPFKAPDGSKQAEYKIRFALADPKEMNENLGIVTNSFDPADEIKGITDLTLSSGGDAIHDVAYIKVLTTEDQVDLYDEYSTLLADADAWVVKSDAGVVITPTGVTADAAKEAIAIAFTSTGTHTFELVSAAALAALGIGGAPGNGFEGENILSIAVPTT